MGVADASDSRLELLSRWVFDDLGFAGSQIAPASADASFRRYFRLTRGPDSYIIMDAPPEKEDSAPFVKIAQLLAGLDLNVPLILARDTLTAADSCCCRIWARANIWTNCRPQVQPIDFMAMPSRR